MYEKQLVNDLKQSSYQAFTQLYTIYSPLLFGFVFKTLKSRSRTSDIVQETFMRIWENRTIIDPDQSFKSFIFSIAHNLLISEYRRQINRPELIDYIEFTNDASLIDNSTQYQLDLDDFISRLKKAKQQLPPRQKEIFELIKEQGMTSTQVAEQLGIGEQVVRNQLSISLSILKNYLKSYMVLFLLFFGN